MPSEAHLIKDGQMVDLPVGALKPDLRQNGYSDGRKVRRD